MIPLLRHTVDAIICQPIRRVLIKGKDAVRRYLDAAEEPPKFTVTDLIAEGDFVTALGEITTKDEAGMVVQQSYCDVWRFRGGKMAALRAFVIKTQS